MENLFVYFFFITIFTFSLAGYDKYKALKNKYRVSEKTLFLLASIGGSIGLLLAMLFFRHKTSKTSFKITFGIIIVLQIAIIIAILNDKF